MKKLLKDIHWGYILIALFLLCAIIKGEVNRSKYPYTTTANLIEVVDPDANKQLVGYDYRNLPVYDKPDHLYKYYTYEYFHEGVRYEFTLQLAYESPATLDIKYDDSNNVLVQRN